MRYYVIDRDTNNKTYVRVFGCFTRQELKDSIGSDKFKIYGKEYHVNDVIAEPFKACSFFGIGLNESKMKERYENIIADYLNKDKL